MRQKLHLTIEYKYNKTRLNCFNKHFSDKVHHKESLYWITF